jgi:hypothetical protein
VRRRVRIALAILLAGVGLVLAALTGASGRLAGDLRHDDAAFEADVSAPGLWAERGSRADRAVRRLAGVDDELALRRAESAFVRSRAQASQFSEEMQRLTVRGDAEASLDEIARTSSDATQRSRAALLLGVLLWEDAHGSGGSGPALVQRSIQAFRAAARSAPLGDDAKYDLELVLDLTQPSGERRRDAPQEAGGQGGIGASAATGGSGY